MSLLQRFQFNSPNPLLGGRYQVIQELGAGGFGQTFLAADLHLPGQPHCVVKQLKPQSNNPDSLEVAARLFDTEAQVLYRLGHHDQIPRLLAHFQDGSEFYLVQEWIDGNPLNEELIAGQPWSEAQVIQMLQSLLDVLAFVHQEKVIHRDIKPSNLMRRRSDGKIVLIDFGAVKQVSTRLSNPHATSTQTISIGTPGYTPNEQMAGTPRFSSDIYAVGMVALQALMGMSPRQLSQDTHTGEILWRDRVPHLTPAIAEMLDRMIRYDFRTRYPTAVEAFAVIQTLAADLNLTTPTLPPLPLVTPPVTLPPALPTEATLAVNPQQNLDPTPIRVRKLFPFLASAQSTVLAPSSAVQGQSGKSLVQANTFKQGMLVDWRDRLATLPHRRILPPAIGLTVLGIAFLGFNATRTPQANSTNQPNASVTQSASPDPSAQVAPLLAQAEQQRTEKQYQSAIDTYDQAIALDPKLAEAHWGRCYSLNYLQRSQDAIAACDAALALRSDYPEALWSKGYALEQQQRYEQALALYERSVVLKPDFAEAWSNKGTVLLLLNRFEESVAAFDKAIALKPELAEAWNNRGAALWTLQRVDESISSIDRAIQIRPDYQDALSLRQQIDQKLNSDSKRKRKKQVSDQKGKVERARQASGDDGDDD